jgi:hypothetical protein
MSQRTLLLALPVVALLVLAAVVFLVSSDSFSLFGGEAGPANRANVQVAGLEDPFAEQQDPAANIKFDGRDEHGRYITGPGGERIYIDSNGRRYMLDPSGRRIYVDEHGRPLGPDGKPIRGGGTSGGGESGTGGGSTGEGGEGKEAPEPVDKEEKKPAELSGQVVDDFGNAYEGAKVNVAIEGGESRSATTDEEGNFAFAQLPAERTLTLTAADAWGNSSKPFTTRLAPGATKLKAPLVLPRDTAIRGVVRDADSGLPIEEAQVLLFAPDNQRNPKESLSTDSGGAFAFAKLTPAGYRLQITRSGYAPRILNNVEPPANLTVEMSPGAVITGTVTNLEGEPIAGAQVSCDFDAEPAQHFHTEAVTDETGYYVVKCQPESQHNVISVIAPGHQSAQKTFVKSGSEGVNFKLKPSGNVVLRGRLLTSSGTPVQQAGFFSYDDAAKYIKIIQSVGPNAEGVFWCETKPEAVELLVRSNGLAEIRAKYTPAPGGEVELGDLYMGQGYNVFGRITRKGEPETYIEGADVSSGAAKTTSDKEGKYRLEGLGAAEFIVRVLHPAYLGTAVRVTPKPGEHEIELNLELSTADFDGRLHITDAATQQPIAGATVTVVAYNMVLTSDAEGMVHVTGLSSMKVDVRIEKAGYATVNTKLDADAPDKTAAKPPQEIAMQRGNTIHGVCTSNGEPLPGATRVEIWDTGKLAATVYTDTEGKYATDSLPVGQYFVGLPDYHYAARAVELIEEGAEFDIEIGTVCHLKGRLLRADGQPHANAGVYVYRRDSVYWCATIHTDPEGRYEVSNLFPGEWVFCALKTQGDTAAQFAVNVNVENAGWNTIDVNLPAVTGVMNGRVTYPDGKPVKRARVAVTNLSANFPRALLAAYVVTDDNGYYTAERLENGAQMQARVGGYQDEAKTATAFSEAVTIPADNSPVEADIVVAREGVTVRATMRRADGGPIQSGGPLCYLYDAQGRLSGLYFGGSGFSGTIDIYDVPPGSYTLVVSNRGMKQAQVQITVVTSNITSGIEVIIEPEDRSSGG